MLRKQIIELHNEEIKEIMKRIPGRIIRWGLAVLFLIFASIIIGSYFFTFRETVKVPLVITQVKPPVPVICKVSGKITRRFVSDGQIVVKGENIAFIQNSTNFPDFCRVEEIILKLDSTETIDGYYKIRLPEKSVLGDLQVQYDKLYYNIQEFRDYYKQKIIPGKIKLLHQQMNIEKQHYRLSLQQQKMMERELNLMQKKIERHEGMLNKGGVFEAQLKDEKMRFIRSKIEYTNFIASLKSIEINMIQIESSLLELKEQQYKTIEQFKINIAENTSILKNSIKEWKDKYLLSSPIKGTVTFNILLNKNQVVSAGKCLAIVVPDDSSGFICRAIVPSSEIGKIKTGQEVNIKLAGYPYQVYGMLTGYVSAVSPVSQDKGYVVKICLNDSIMSGYNEKLRLVGKMEGTAEIIVSEMRMIYRFITPLKIIFKK